MLLNDSECTQLTKTNNGGNLDSKITVVRELLEVTFSTTAVGIWKFIRKPCFLAVFIVVVFRVLEVVWKTVTGGVFHITACPARPATALVYLHRIRQLTSRSATVWRHDITYSPHHSRSLASLNDDFSLNPRTQRHNSAIDRSGVTRVIGARGIV